MTLKSFHSRTHGIVSFHAIYFFSVMVIQNVNSNGLTEKIILEGKQSGYDNPFSG